jgi:Salmonella virulence plasmid 65kDa B protein
VLGARRPHQDSSSLLLGAANARSTQAGRRQGWAPSGSRCSSIRARPLPPEGGRSDPRHRRKVRRQSGHRRTGSLTVPIAVSPGRSGFGPQLSLSYDPGAGNGPFGFGWSLSFPTITRKTDKGLPQYRDAEEAKDKKAAGRRFTYSGGLFLINNGEIRQPDEPDDWG